MSKEYSIDHTGKVRSGNKLVADLRRLQGWKTFSPRQVGIWVAVAQKLAFSDYSRLIECGTAQWWLALCEQDGGRACAKSHIERLAASQLRFRDWDPKDRTLLDRHMTASNLWGRTLGVLNAAGIHYTQQLTCTPDEVLLRHVNGLRPQLLRVARYAVRNSES